ncbi:MAG TPA: hypothetical protein V6C97_31435 [Oculatellaceae cyanobacterium]
MFESFSNLSEAKAVTKLLHFDGQTQLGNEGLTIAVKQINFDNTRSLVTSGILPALHMDSLAEPLHAIDYKKAWQFDSQSDGSAGGDKPWQQPAYEGSWYTGKHHITPAEKLWNTEYESLTPAEKLRYNAENQVATKYQSDLLAWELGGKKGQQPVKPEIPEHDKVAARVADDEKAIEKQVRAAMSPDEQAKYDKAKAQYEKDKAANGPFTPVPEELAAYNKRLAEAIGMKTESTRDFIEGQINSHPGYLNASNAIKY